MQADPLEKLSIERPIETCRSLQTIAQWLNDEWGRVQGYSYEDTLSWCRSLSADEREAIICAKVAGQPAGVVVLVDCDLPSHPHFSPWLSSLYVLPEYRCLGIGSLLTSSLCEVSAKLGHRQVYLYVLDGLLVSFYGRRGWLPVENITIEGSKFTIMRKTLSTPNRRLSIERQ